MVKLYVNGENAILGRLGSFVAKKLLQGDEVVVVNSEKVVISGEVNVTVEKIRNLRKKGGASQKGPDMPKLSDRMLKRKIRGMLPWDKAKGRDAYKRLRCEIGNNLSEEEKKKLIKFDHRLPAKYVSLEKVTELLR